ncbi:hypothetical protein nbrc107696_07440 [Gordonia spumicola]|uniref:Uncharacterized protein n=1 Tax=Gordonia spumicola TaxID=589161 RepID=A0A7I9V4E9_9ACTN|nr:hypothetical protein [Gordonia spumicola]GEE00298.1 hypothetical protein nbrc107696_07440 [Gordonia spumicola]
MADRYERLQLAPDLHVTRHDDFLTVASTRWTPGTFLYDLDYLVVTTKPSSTGVKVILAARGAHVDFQVLRFELDAPTWTAFDAFVARARQSVA